MTAAPEGPEPRGGVPGTLTADASLAEKFRKSALRAEGESLSDSAAAILIPSAPRLRPEEEPRTGSHQQLGGRSTAPPGSVPSLPLEVSLITSRDVPSLSFRSVLHDLLGVSVFFSHSTLT